MAHLAFLVNASLNGLVPFELIFKKNQMKQKDTHTHIQPSLCRIVAHLLCHGIGLPFMLRTPFKRCEKSLAVSFIFRFNQIFGRENIFCEFWGCSGK